MARKLLRQKSTVKSSLRLRTTAMVTASAGLVALLIIVFNVSKREEGKAQNSMSFKEAMVYQDTARVLRGSIHQKVIGVVVEVTGKGAPLKLNAMSFSAKGTSEPVEANVENARLWYTGNDPSFSTQQTIGKVIQKVGSRPFEFVGVQSLLPGKNYFWLTVDVKADALTAPGTIDAMCHEIRIGDIAFLPLIADPLGKRFIQANVPYFSTGNYAVNKVASWNSKRDGTGSSPRQMNETRNSYFIQSGHRMISSTGSNLQTLVVEKGGELRITSPLRLNSMLVACGGVVQMDTSLTDAYVCNEMFMESGAMYIHNSTGLFPANTSVLDRNSSQVYFQYSPLSFRPDVQFGHLILDAADAPPTDLNGRIRSIQGNWEIRRTGPSERGVFFSGHNKIAIGGDLIQTGGVFSGALTGELECMVKGNFIMKGGAFLDGQGKEGASFQLVFERDVMMLGGTFETDNNPISLLRFTGKNQSRWIQKQECGVQLGDVQIDGGHSLVIKGSRMGAISKGRNLTVREGGELYCDQGVLTGEGGFILDTRSTLGIGHPEGIFSKGNRGNVQTESRNFHSDATYLYYTASHPQQTGVFLTQPRNNVVRRLLVNKASPSQVVQLSQDIFVEEQCKVNLGDLRQNGFELKLNAGASAGL